MAWIRVLLSLFIVYHLMAVVLSPNANSFLGRVLGSSYLAYANIIGVNTPWNFFSPDPADSFRIEYKIRFSEASQKRTLQKVLPSWYNTGTFSPTLRRDLYLTRYIMIDQTRLTSMFGPWLCRKYPGASEIVSRFVIQKLPPLDRALLDKEGWHEEVKDIDLTAFTHYCNDFSESEAL